MNQYQTMRIIEGVIERLATNGKLRHGDLQHGDTLTITYNPALRNDDMILIKAKNEVQVGNWYRWVFFAYQEDRNGFDKAVDECCKWAMKKLEQSISKMR